MSRLGLALGSSLVIGAAGMGCRQIAGIGPITYSGTEGGAGGCTNASLVISSSDELDLLTTTNGYVFGSVLSSTSGTDTNIVSCQAGSTCSQPKGLLNLAFNDTLEGYAPGAKIFYAVQATPGTSSLHSIGYDGTGDQVVLGSLQYPMWVAVSGSRTFWVDDDGSTATVHCVGCSGPGDTTWMTGLSATTGMFADANDVYVLADDGTVNATTGIFGCSVQTACNATVRTVIKGLQPTAYTPVTQFASDGSNVYASNGASQVIRIDPAGAQTAVAKNVEAVAIAVDGATGDLFYGEGNGTIARVKSDGSSTPVPISQCEPNDVMGVAVDATNVYVLVVSGTASTVYAIKRN